MRVGAGSRWGLLALAGCASIQTTEVVTDTPLPADVRTERVEDSLTYEVSARTHDGYIALSIAQSESCAKVTVPRVHRVRSFSRTADSTVTRTTWTVAALALGTAVYGFVDDTGVLHRNDSGVQGADPRDRQYELGLAGVGVVAVVIGLVDLARASDSERDDGEVRGKARREESTCRAHRTVNARVELALPNGHAVAGTTDERGTVELSMLEIPEDGVPDAAPLVSKIAGASVHVELSSRDRDTLREALRVDPRSRMAIDIAARRRAECDRGVTSARDATPPEPAEPTDSAADAWTAARATCGELWTTALEAEQATVAARIAFAACGRRIVAIGSTISDGDLDAVDETGGELLEIVQACSSPVHVADERRLASKLAGLEKRRDAQRGVEERRVAREQAREEAAERRREVDKARRARSWSNSALMCNDGTASPSCTCGGSHRGCCSWHGGVAGCAGSE